jgi:predicted AAA+ superfamily ATPase
VDMHYVVIDEVQMVDHFPEVLNSLLLFNNVDTYVTGSNSRFLSSDIATEFRGRSFEIHLAPLSFSEYMSACSGSVQEAWASYSTYGGLPGLLSMDTEDKKTAYLRQLFNTVYLRDIMERNRIENVPEIKELIRVMASCVGSLTNINNLTNAFSSKKNLSITNKTVASYVKYFEESFLIEHALRYDIRGKGYIGAQSKYYFQDIGLRNALLSFRQLDRGHIMENVIYNELRQHGYSVDVGNVETRNAKGSRAHLEVDFVASKGSQKFYIQSALSMESLEKQTQEKRSLHNIDDSFKKIVVTKNDLNPTYDDEGVMTVDLFDFLLNKKILETDLT